jgi:hypothetical protein
MHFPAALGFMVYSVDGRRELSPAVIPEASHPALAIAGDSHV